MKMLLLLFLFVPVLLFAQPTPVQVKPVKDYFFSGDNNALKKGLNCLIIKNRKQFEKLFGETDRADTPDFQKEMMLLLLLPATKKEAKLVFRRITMKAGDFIEVYCEVDKNVQPLTYLYNPLSACIIPKYPGIRHVDFYDVDDMKLISTVDVGEKH